MPELHGEIPYNKGDIPMAPCVWCKEPTDNRFVPAGMPHLGLQPLHILCGMQMIRAYQRWKAGMVLPEQTMKRLEALTGVPLGR